MTDYDSPFLVPEATTPPAPGDFVKIHPAYGTKAQQAVYYIVTKQNTKTIDFEPVVGGRGIRSPFQRVLRLEPGTPEYDTAKARHEANKGPRVHAGSIVTFKPGKVSNAPAADQLCVVLEVAIGSVKLTKLGGMEDGRWWAQVPLAHLVLVDPATVGIMATTERKG